MQAKTETGRQTSIGGTSFPVLPESNNSVSLGDTIISASNLNFIKLINAAPITVTNITGGRAGVPVSFLGDGQTTFKNNTTIKTNTGADKLLGSNKIYRFTHLSGVWYEDA